MLPRVFNILLIEDDALDVIQIQRSLEKTGLRHSLFRANNGEEAYDMLKGKNNIAIPRPHFILLDLNMPKMDGVEFLSVLRSDKNFADLTVFILTTSSTENDKVEAFKYNVAGYILKPVTFDHFHESLSCLSSFVSICEFPG